MSDWLTLARAVPIERHVVTFKFEAKFKMRASCGGCGWTLATDLFQSDALYWKAREHFADMVVSGITEDSE